MKSRWYWPEVTILLASSEFVESQVGGIPDMYIKLLWLTSLSKVRFDSAIYYLAQTHISTIVRYLGSSRAVSWTL